LNSNLDSVKLSIYISGKSLLPVRGILMKRFGILLFTALLALPTTGAFAGMIGPPYPAGREDQVTVGVGYFYGRNVWEAKDDSATKLEFNGGNSFLELSFQGFSLSEQGALFLRRGVSDLDDGKGFDSKNNPFGQIGMRDIWYGEGRRSGLAVGTVVQAGWYADAKESLGAETVTVGNRWDASLAVALQWKFPGMVTLYGGAFASYGEAEVTKDITGVGSGSGKIREEDLFGGFAGARLTLWKRLAIDVEAQFQSVTSVGATIGYSF
jgi:hypothetical protein